jgi:outer membrane protein OmpA-like peptidoglycan-associated protein
VPFPRFPVLLLVALLPLCLAVGRVQAQDCDAILQKFNGAIDGGREADAAMLVDIIARDAACGRYQVQAQRRLAALRLRSAQTLMARGRPVAEYERMLTDSARPEVLWQASATLGEVRFGERRFAEAAAAFDTAIEIVRNESVTPTPPAPFEIQDLVDRAAQARILAVNISGEAGVVQTVRSTRDGRLGGLYAASIRGIVPRAVPVPITFDYNKTSFTPAGQAAAQELLTALREQQPARILVVGHTDVRGGADYNQKLSVARAEAVAAFLRDNGVSAEITTEGRGASEPLQLTDTSGLSQDDIYALNRRVEWIREAGSQ